MGCHHLMMVMGTTGCSLSDTNGDNDPKIVICPTGNERADIKLSSEEAPLVIHNNDFAFNLFRASAETGKSQILSPLSITYALGLLNNDAVGDTSFYDLQGRSISQPSKGIYIVNGKKGTKFKVMLK